MACGLSRHLSRRIDRFASSLCTIILANRFVDRQDVERQVCSHPPRYAANVSLMYLFLGWVPPTSQGLHHLGLLAKRFVASGACYRARLMTYCRVIFKNK